MAIKLTYFDIEGAAEPVRLALTLTETSFEDDRVKFENWPALKATTKYGQLPVMKIGEDTVVQSGAMLRHIGRNYGGGKLYPSEPKAVLETEEVLGLIEDFNRAWTPCLYIGMRPAAFGYPEDFTKTDAGKATMKALRESFLKETLPTYMKHFTAQIGSRKFLLGDEPTVADCLLFPNLRKFQRGFIDHVPADSLDQYTEIAAYIQRVKDIPAIAKWYSK